MSLMTQGSCTGALFLCCLFDVMRVLSKYCDWATSWTAEELWFIFWQDRGFSFSDCLGPVWPHIQCILEALSLGVKQAGHETDHLHLSVAEVRNEWNPTSLGLFAFLTGTGRSLPLHLLYLYSLCELEVLLWCRFSVRRKGPHLLLRGVFLHSTLFKVGTDDAHCLLQKSWEFLSLKNPS